MTDTDDTAFSDTILATLTGGGAEQTPQAIPARTVPTEPTGMDATISAWKAQQRQEFFDATAELRSALLLAGIETLTVDFDGYGDEGSVSVDDDLSEALLTRATDWGYKLLFYKFSGWDQNEGTYGSITFNATTGVIAFNGAERYIESRPVPAAWHVDNPDEMADIL